MRLAVPLLLLAILACAERHGGDPPAGAAPQALLVGPGADLFVRHCASCHGVDARGAGPAATALRTPPADLTRIAGRRSGAFPDGEIAMFVDGRFELDAHGTREMPVWGRRLAEPIAAGHPGDDVARGRIAALVEYLKSIQR